MSHLLDILLTQEWIKLKKRENLHIIISILDSLIFEDLSINQLKKSVNLNNKKINIQLNILKEKEYIMQISPKISDSRVKNLYKVTTLGIDALEDLKKAREIID